MAFVHYDPPKIINRCKSHKLILKLPGETYIPSNEHLTIFYCPQCGYWEYADDATHEVKYVKH